MSLTDLLVPTYRQMLRTLSALLEKAVDQKGQEADALLDARLAPDMFPLKAQLRFVSRQVEEAVTRLRGEPVPPMAADGREMPTTMAEAQARLAETIVVLDALSPDALDAGADLQISLDLPGGIAFELTGEQFARDWALPQFYFHLVTAYAILRNQGVEIGKADYVPYMVAYLRKDLAAPM